VKILLLDIETAPNLVHVWGLWQQNVAINQIQAAGYVMCWSAKWLGEPGIMFASVYKSSAKKMLAPIHKLLDEADAVIHYNGSRFDIPTLNKEFLLHGMPPPSPAKNVDLLLTARDRFRFPSNKLDYIAKVLAVGQKTKHTGHELWVRCMAGDAAAWKIMERYNRNDVALLERVYKKMLPWIKQHPSFGLYEGRGMCCTNCGSEKLQARGYSRTAVNTYKRFQCLGCGTWTRSPVTQTTTKERRELLRPALA